MIKNRGGPGKLGYIRQVLFLCSPLFLLPGCTNDVGSALCNGDGGSTNTARCVESIEGKIVFISNRQQTPQIFVKELGSNDPPQQITSVPGLVKRYPRWSPDGEHIAFISDESINSSGDGARGPKRHLGNSRQIRRWADLYNARITANASAAKYKATIP